MLKTFKYRLKPNKEQELLLTQQLEEACCLLYNTALEERIHTYRMQRKSVSLYKQQYQLKDIRADKNVDIVNFSVCVDVLKRVDRAYKAFFRRIKNGEKPSKPGFPRFRSKYRYDNCTSQLGWKLNNNCLYLQGIGNLKLKLHRKIEGTVKSCTVRRIFDKWYVCFASNV